MFDHDSGSGGFSPLWLLVSVVIGASLNTTKCFRAQAQPIDLSLSHKVFSAQEVEDSTTTYGYAGGVAPGRAHPRWIEETESKA